MQFLRTYCDCVVTTGKILRKEKMAFHPDIPEMLKLPKKVYFKKGGKPVAILTNNLQISQDGSNINQIYLDNRYKKHIITKPSVLKRY